MRYFHVLRQTTSAKPHWTVYTRDRCRPDGLFLRSQHGVASKQTSTSIWPAALVHCQLLDGLAATSMRSIPTTSHLGDENVASWTVYSKVMLRKMEILITSSFAAYGGFMPNENIRLAIASAQGQLKCDSSCRWWFVAKFPLDIQARGMSRRVYSM
ncbi:hypothetical protein ASPBRDRAFT_600214 [Aspergillus brasiliensis CBS 101740]|uniref:Uncharacterized protein n=1 Tax=Aspergillus brasiliensis (strain CBS 101740 / IMI 381727 / IBT 21946) TaxID=767769 RepID=A0A1L9UH51_ASPBC|nr:hypothetical protein ASPBRDRAFT_600214 [Aspergillus brasiliensis CBS 101740]